MNARRHLVAILVLAGAACTMNDRQRDARPDSSSTASASAAKEGWRPLFDGQTTNGWREFGKTSMSPGWEVIDGSLVRARDGAGDIITEDEFENFDLALEWKVAEGGNSGIFYRATEQVDTIWHAAPEMQVLDDAHHPDGKSRLTAAGANYGLYPAPPGVVHPAGEWNLARIVVNDDHVEHWLNGVKLFEYDFGSPEWSDRVQKSKFSTRPLFGKVKRGHIGLQDHGDRVEFRNIRIRVLP